MSQNERIWPDKIVYICSATKAAAVNWVSLRDAGASRIAGLVVLVGAKDMDAPTESEIIHAVQPYRALREEALGLGLDAQRVVVINGDPDDMTAWMEAMDQASQLAADTATIVMNPTGGTKQMALGALLGYNASMAPLRMISVPKVGRPRLLIPSDNSLSGRPFPRVASDNEFDVLLRVNGLMEHDSDKRLKVMQWRDRPAQIAAIDAISKGKVLDRIHMVGALNRALHDKKATVRVVVTGDTKFRQTYENALAFAAMVDDVERDGDALIIGSKEAVDFLRGGWLEHYVYTRLCKKLVPMGFQVMTGLELTTTDEDIPEKQRLSRQEIDVMVYGKDMAVAIECKSGKRASGSERDIRALEDVRDRLSGPAVFVKHVVR